MLIATTVVAAMAVPARAATFTQIWVDRYEGGRQFSEYHRQLAVSPDGSTVYVTGTREDLNTTDAITTIAYDAATGERIWLDDYSLAQANSGGTVVVVSPDGRKVFVGDDTSAGGLIVAYDATTGEQLWVRPNAPGRNLAVSPDSRHVFSTGGPDTKIVTRSYSSATGMQEWSRSYSAPEGVLVGAAAITVNPQSTRVFVAGSVGDRYAGVDNDFITLGYAASTGARVWSRLYDDPSHRDDVARAIAVTPNGRHVIVGGMELVVINDVTRRTITELVSYAAGTGSRAWVSRDGSSSQSRSINWDAMTIDPAGTSVFVTGTQSVYDDGWTDLRYRTVSFSVATGAMRWSNTFSGVSFGSAVAIAISPDGTMVYVTGFADDASHEYTYATVAYVAGTGDQVASVFYDSAVDLLPIPTSIAVSRIRSIFVTGDGDGAYATIAYELG